MTKQYVFTEEEYEEIVSKLKNTYNFIDRTIDETNSSNAYCSKEYLEDALNIVYDNWHIEWLL